MVVIGRLFRNEKQNSRDRRKHSSYLNDRWQFGHALSSEICQLKAAENIKETGNSGLQCKPRLDAEIF
jgi:hypothetical protein